MPTRHCNALGYFWNVDWRWNLNNSFLRINFTLASSDIQAFNKGRIYNYFFHTTMLILLILIVHYCKKIKTKCLKAIQEFWKVSLTLFPATCICPVYGLKEKHHLEEIFSLRLKGYCLVQMPWNCDCDLTKLSSFLVLYGMSGSCFLGYFYWNAQCAFLQKKAWLLLQGKQVFLPFLVFSWHFCGT